MMNRIELKQEAKGVVRTAAVSAYLFALLYLALTELLQGASVYVNGDVALYMQTYFPNVPIPSYLYPVALPATVVTLGILSIWIAPYIIQTNIGYFQEIKRIKGIGWQARPEQPDDTFRPTDPFGPEL